MKKSERIILTLITLTILTSISAFSQNLFDDFNDTSVDTNSWNVILPFPQSHVAEGVGFLTLTGRGTLATVANFTFPYIISGSVTLSNSFEHFGTFLRTDLSVWSPEAQYHELTGIGVIFSADGNEISIQQFDPSNNYAPYLTYTNYNFSIGHPYDFTIVDTGTSVRLEINGVILLTAESAFSTGHKVAFESREFPTTSSSLDFISISSTPTIEIKKAVYLTSNTLVTGSNYIIQISSDMQNWTNTGSLFTATTNYWRSTNYFNVADWNSLFFRFQAQ